MTPSTEPARQRHKDTRWIAGGLFVILVVLVFVFYFIQKGRNLPPDLVTNRVLLFVLWYANVVLILAIVFILLRYIYRLLVERRNRILGSRFKTKLVVTYIALSLLPVLALFAYGSELLHGWIERWFSQPALGQFLQQGEAVSQALNRQLEEARIRDAGRVSEAIDSIDLRDPRRAPQLDRALKRQLDRLDLDYVGVFVGGEFVHALFDSQSGLTELPEPGPQMLRDAVLNDSAARLVAPPRGEGRLVLGARAMGRGGEERPVVVAGTLLDPALAGAGEQLIEAYQGYRQLELQKSDIRASYLLTFLMVTLLLLLGAFWVSFYLAGRVTVPIQALAEATRRISEGDLEYRVEVDADDELGVLVGSFNRMTSELARNKQLLEESNAEMIAANERLAEERAVISAVLHNVAAGVISVDEEGLILTCNGAARDMLEQTEHDLIGRPVREAWADDERRKLAELFGAAEGHTVAEVRMVLGGQWKTFEAKVTRMRDRDGGSRGRVMVLEDLTELIKAQQLAAWNEAARRIAHEIKNPLTPIKLAAERMRKKTGQTDPELAKALDESVDIIVGSVQTMKSMVDEFSRFARMPYPQPAEVDLEALFADTLRLYEKVKPGVEVETGVEETARTVWLDAEQFRRVLINLLDNAFDATEAPGQVTLSAGRRDGFLRISVADTGPGIPPDAREKLFLPHFSTKGRGSGLGLSIVHRIVTDHRGTIRVDANRPHGTVFTIELPQR